MRQFQQVQRFSMIKMRYNNTQVALFTRSSPGYGQGDPIHQKLRPSVKNASANHAKLIGTGVSPELSMSTREPQPRSTRAQSATVLSPQAKVHKHAARLMDRASW
jgi:hypothetical protein